MERRKVMDRTSMENFSAKICQEQEAKKVALQNMG
jgi:hypothetical protein